MSWDPETGEHVEEGAVAVDLFDDDTPLACGLEDVDYCESCQ